MMRTAFLIGLLVGAGGAPAQDEPWRIDTHMHVGGMADSTRGSGQRPTPGGPRRSQGGQRPARPDMSAEYNAAADTLVRLMDERGVARSMVVVVPTPEGRSDEEETRLISDAVRRHPDRLKLMSGGAVLCQFMEDYDPDEVTNDVRRRFEQAAERILEEGAVGFGEMIVLHFSLGPTHPFFHHPADHPLFLLLADIAARHDVPIDIHMEAVPEEMETPENLRRASSRDPERLPASIPALERLLAHNPDARIVWQHIGWDNIGFMTPERLGGLLEAHPNLYLSLRVEARPMQVGGGQNPMPNRIVDRNGRIQPAWLELLQAFPDRIMIGSDEFVGSSGSPEGLTRSFAETWTMAGRLPEDLLRRVGADNARRVYGLE